MVQKELSAKSFIYLDNNVVGSTVSISSDEYIIAKDLDPEENDKIIEDTNDVDVDVEVPNQPSNTWKKLLASYAIFSLVQFKL